MKLKVIGTPEELAKARELLAAAKGIEYIEEKQMQESAEPPDMRQVLQQVRQWPRLWRKLTSAICPTAFEFTHPTCPMINGRAASQEDNIDDICERCWRDAMEGEP